MPATQQTLLAILAATALTACSKTEVTRVPTDTDTTPKPVDIQAGRPVESMPGEVRFRNVRQLTFGGENAEAYWSFDGTRLIYQTKRPPYGCDQIHVLDLRTGEDELVSTGKGRTTCAYFLQDDERIVYASTHLAGDDCPPAVWRPGGVYVWGVYASYDIFSAKPDGTDLVRMTDTPGYDAEATVCPVTGRIVFTSVRDGDLELYLMDGDGSNVTRLTNRLGYDGGAFFSHDGKKIVQRSGFFEDDAERDKYVELLADAKVQPNKMEITVLNVDGTGFRKVTDNGKANFAPYWHPDNERIMFSSNMDSPRGRDFELYLVREDGTDLERVTHNPDSFDGFPMWSPDGKWIAFASNRYGSQRGETNVFVAEWVEDPKKASASEATTSKPAGGGRGN